MTLSHDILRQKLAESISRPPYGLTRRLVREPSVSNKVRAVIGVRRSGKTSYLLQCRNDAILSGRPPESQLVLSLEDERLAGITAADLRFLVEEHERQYHSAFLGSRPTLYLDEVQVVAGWEGFVRRMVDQGDTDIYVSGSSAKLLSREVATSLRGRAVEVLVHPFSFREALRHTSAEPSKPFNRMTRQERSHLDAQLRLFLASGGFPEAQGTKAFDRVALLTGYVDVVVFRDVVERHNVSNVLPLRWLVRHLLANPAGQFSVKRLYDSLRSQGVAVGKDTLHDYLAFLEDTFLVRTVWMHGNSERQRMVNPRKVYPIDTGLISIYDRSGGVNSGKALETAVLLELERRGYQVSYVRTANGFEVDFLAQHVGAKSLLIQVSMETEGDATWDRECRALEHAAAEHPTALPILLTLDASPPLRPLPSGAQWMSAAQWLLEDDSSLS